MAELRVRCPGCHQGLIVPSEAVGRNAKCPACGREFLVTAGPASPAAAGGDPAQAPAPAPAAPPLAPEAGIPGLEPLPAGSQTLTPLIASHLRATRPWVLFLSILGFILCGLIVLAAMAMTLVGFVTGGPFGAGFGMVISLLYVAFGALYFVPAWLLFSYAGAIKQFVDTRQNTDLERALGKQKSFWKFVGIMTLVVMCLYAVILVIALVGGLAGAFLHGGMGPGGFHPGGR